MFKKSKWTLDKPYCTEPTSVNYLNCKAELKDTGISSDELWSLYIVISEFILPRLKMFNDRTCSVPAAFCTESDGKIAPELDRWNKVLDKMIYAFSEISNMDCASYDVTIDDKVNEGLDLFRKFFFDLWL